MNVNMLYHFMTVISHILLHQPAWQWPPLSNHLALSPLKAL